MTAIAEGVETREQLNHLQRLNCPMAQCFYFAKPLPAAAAEHLLVTWSRIADQGIADQ